MKMTVRPVRRILTRRKCVVGLILSLSAIWLTARGALEHSARPASPDQTGPIAGDRPTIKPLAVRVALRPGTAMEKKGAPQGWTHVVVRSFPRLSTGDLDTFPVSLEKAQKIGGMFHTAVLAEVAADPKSTAGARIVRIGVGLSMRSGEKEIVVATDQLDSLGITLGTIPRMVLSGCEREIARGKIIARSPSLAIYQTPGTLKAESGHQKIWLRYALLAMPDGSLRSLAFAVPIDSAARKAVETISIMTPGLIRDCQIDVIAKRLLNRVPVSWSFAMLRLPEGEELPMPARLRELATRDELNATEIALFEKTLRRLVADKRGSDESD